MMAGNVLPVRGIPPVPMPPLPWLPGVLTDSGMGNGRPAVDGK